MKDPLEHKSLLIVEPLAGLPGLKPTLEQAGWSVEASPDLIHALARVVRSSFAAVLLHEDGLPDDPRAIQELKNVRPDLAVVAAVTLPRRLSSMDDLVFVPCELDCVTRVLEKAYERQQGECLLVEMRQDNERLRGAVAAEQKQVATLERAWVRLSQTVSNLEALCKAVLELFAEVAGARRLSLMLVERNNGEQLRIVEAQGLPDDVVAETRLELGEAIAGWVAKHARPMHGTGETAPASAGWAGRTYNGDSFLSTPLNIGDEVVGVLNLTDRVPDEPFNEAEVERLSFLAQQAAVWIDCAQKFQQARKLSLTDELTSLYNRRYFTDTLERELARAGRAGQRCSLAMLDVDHFKAYNDTYGHLAGDELLKELGLALQKSVRSTDVVCRYGGEEFAIILPPTSNFDDDPGRDAVQLVERLRVIVSRLPITGVETQPAGHLAISAGVASFPDDAGGPGDLVSAADKMLYKAKRTGRNRVCAAHKKREKWGK